MPLHSLSMLLLVLASTPATAADAWPTFRNGALNTGFSSLSIGEEAMSPYPHRLPRTTETSGLIWATAVSDAEGTVYVGSSDKHLYAISAEGTTLWTYRLTDRADSLIDSASALTPDGKLVIPGGDGILHAVDRVTGRRLWLFHAHHASDDSHQSGAVVNSFEGNVQVGPDGTIYAGSDNGTLYALDGNGRERWAFRTGMMIWSSPAVDPANRWLAFGSLDGNLYVLDPSTGRELARLKFKDSIKSSPSSDGNGRLFFGVSDGTIRAVDLDLRGPRARLTPAWAYKTGDEVYSSGATHDGKVVFGSLDGGVYCLDSRTGRRLWVYRTGSRVAGSPVITRDGAVLFGAKNGKIYALELSTGERRWSFRTTDRGVRANLDASASVTADGRVVIGSYSGLVHDLPLETCPRYPGDARCEFGGFSDIPAFTDGVAEDEPVLRVQDRLGRYSQAPAAALALAEPLRLRLVSVDENGWNPRAVLNPNQVTVETSPKVEIEAVVSSDGRTLNVRPKRHYSASTEYRLTVRGRVLDQEKSWLLDRLRPFWAGRPFAWTTRFHTVPHSGGLNGGPEDLEGATWGVKSLFLYQPEALETYTPAALDGQGFRISLLGSAPGHDDFALLALPALPTEAGVRILSEPSKAFVLRGTLQDRAIRAVGGFRLAAMGAEMKFRRFGFEATLDHRGGLSEATFHGTASCLSIRANAGSFQFPMSLLNQVCDHRLRVQVEGSLEGRRDWAAAEDRITGVRLESLARRKRPRQVEAKLVADEAAVLPETFLATLVAWDEKRRAPPEQITLAIRKSAFDSAGRATVRFPIPMRRPWRDSDLTLLLNGATLR
ncbi:MAG: PQQ-like beta-propeller repeat protein [Bdellovibrionales bacterium]|nr:PQQ-like beta-propeller repeat protein [Bdellovibrionales bacterium]